MGDIDDLIAAQGKRVKHPKKFRNVIIARAKAAFLAGRTYQEVANEVGIKSFNTIYKWNKKYGWEAEKQALMERVEEEQATLIFQHSTEVAKETVVGLNAIKNASKEAMDTGAVTPRKFGEAASSYIEAAKLEREIMKEAFQHSFIQGVLTILREEIQDSETLVKIGKRLQSLVSPR